MAPHIKWMTEFESLHDLIPTHTHYEIHAEMKNDMEEPKVTSAVSAGKSSFNAGNKLIFVFGSHLRARINAIYVLCAIAKINFPLSMLQFKSICYPQMQATYSIRKHNVYGFDIRFTWQTWAQLSILTKIQLNECQSLSLTLRKINASNYYVSIQQVQLLPFRDFIIERCNPEIYLFFLLK